MNSSKEIADQFREVYISGKWVVFTNMKAQLEDVSWEEATTKIGKHNTIAALVFHLNYYVDGVANVLEGGGLDIRDKYSFDVPPIESQEDWENLRNKSSNDANRFARLIEQLPEAKLDGAFVDEKYGRYRRNLHAMIEHSYYHLGQIVLLKKLIRERV